MPLHIAFTSPDALRERCDVTTVRTTDTEPAYEPGAVIPAVPWRPITDAAARALTAPTATPSSTLVEIVRPPLPTQDRLDDLALPLGDAQAQYIGQALAKPDMLRYPGRSPAPDRTTTAWRRRTGGSFHPAVRVTCPLRRGAKVRRPDSC